MKVRVWNDNVYEYKEKFEEDVVVIKPKSFVLMEEDQAIMFRGTYSPILVDGDGQHLAKSYKMIRLEKIEKLEPKAEEHKCQACGESHKTKDDLENHIDEYHLDELDPEVAVKRRGRPKKTA